MYVKPQMNRARHLVHVLTARTLSTDGSQANFAGRDERRANDRIPCMSEIYPVEDLEWENNSVGNQIRPAMVKFTLSST